MPDEEYDAPAARGYEPLGAAGGGAVKKPSPAGSGMRPAVKPPASNHTFVASKSGVSHLNQNHIFCHRLFYFVVALVLWTDTELHTLTTFLGL